MLLTTGFLLVAAAALRLVPRLIAPYGAGVDQWFWRAYIERLRGTREFPPRLDQFLLDEAQWYPPLFPLLLARLPAAVFERYAGEVAIAIDLIRMLLLIAAVRLVTGSEEAALVAGGVYALTPLLVTYNLQLNPRGLGALFLDGAWLCVGAIIVAGAPPWLWICALICAGLVLLTHKMTTQLLFFTAVTGAVLATDFHLALLIPGAMVVALLLSGGFYRFVLRAHADILSFWYRNWHWSGSNPVDESPIYGEQGFESPAKFYRKGLRAWLRRLLFVLGFNPWMVAALAVGCMAWSAGYEFSRIEQWVFAWLALTLAFALLTTAVPALRCLGQGYLYGYNGAFPAAFALGLTTNLRDAWYWAPAVALTASVCIAALAVYFIKLRDSRTQKVDRNLDAALKRLATLPSGTVMCLPQHWHDVVAYRTRQPVAFGGHGYGFRRLEPLFPRLLLPVREVMLRYGVRYLLTYANYLNERFVADLPAAEIETFGDYQLYRFTGEPQ